MCISPLTLRRKNASIFGETTRQVPCGRCMECLHRRSQGWTLRLMQEAKRSSSCAFLTLTYEAVPLSRNGLPTLLKPDFQDFMKRLRHKTHNKLKYYACGEYGSETNRPHYHAIIYNMPLKFIKDTQVMDETWDRGITHIVPGNELTMAYVTKYINKRVHDNNKYILDEDTGEMIEDDRIREFSLMIKKLGDNFMTKAMTRHLKENLTGTVKINGFHTSLPRYYKEKMFTPEERAKLSWLAKEAREEQMIKFFQDNPVFEAEWKARKIKQYKKQLKDKRNSL